MSMQTENELDELKLKKSKRLIAEVLKNGSVLFCDQFGNAFIAVMGNGNEVFRISSKDTKLWLRRLGWENLDETLGSETIKTACELLEAKAHFDGEKIYLHVRTAYQNGFLWYDLGDNKAVQLNEHGWQIIEDVPIIFRRFQHSKVQILPAENGDLNKIFDFVNISNKQEKLLFLVFLVTAFIPGFPHPILTLHGLQGAAKSSTCRLLKSLIDPSSLNTLSTPPNIEQFVQTASHHWLLAFDNISMIPEWLSDALCRLSTGEGFSKRELYSDDGDIIYSYQHVAIINGINQVVTKPDLLDRLIILELERISPEKRITEKTLLNNLEKEKGLILGSIFDVLTRAFEKYPTIKTTKLPRMADFAQWGCAVSLALGASEEDFLKAYAVNINSQNEEAIEASPVALSIKEFMKNQKEWLGQPTELYKKLIQIADDLQIDKKAGGWPKDPARLGKKIKEIQNNLQCIGINFESQKSGERQYRLTNLSLSDQSVPTAHTVPSSVSSIGLADARDALDGKKDKHNIPLFNDISLKDIDDEFGIDSISQTNK